MRNALRELRQFLAERELCARYPNWVQLLMLASICLLALFRAKITALFAG